MAAGTAYTQRYSGGFANNDASKPVDQTFLNNVETALLQLIGQAPAATDGLVMQWDNANTRYGPALILNKNVDPAAAISKSKLDFTGANGIVNADVAGAAAIARSKLDFGAGLVNADVSTAAAIAASKVIGAIGSVATTLPGSPSDGQITVLVDSTSAPTYLWVLVWNSTASKWYYVGGLPAVVIVDTSEGLADSAAATSYNALATAGPSFTVPNAGDYYVEVGSFQSSRVDNGTQQVAYHSFDTGGTGAINNDAAKSQPGDSASLGQTTSASVTSGPRLKTGLAASTALVSKYKMSGHTVGQTPTPTFANRFMRVHPKSVT